MCGIAGVLGSFSENKIARKVEKMCTAIRNRGSDNHGFSVLPQQGIGMTRLGIIDPEGDRQSIWFENKIGIVFNGEIYNYKELRESLVKCGASFHTNSDTEVISQLYYHEGIEGLKKLEGKYGICLLDRINKRAFFIRDPIGIKPFYYGNMDGGFYFASEIKSIIAACEKKLQINFQGLHDYLSFRYVPGPQTIWNNVFKLQPGHMIEYDLDNHTYSDKQYWSPDFNSSSLDSSRNYEKRVRGNFSKVCLSAIIII